MEISWHRLAELWDREWPTGAVGGALWSEVMSTYIWDVLSLTIHTATRTPTAIVISSDYISARVRLLSRSSTLLLWIFKLLQYLCLKVFFIFYFFEGNVSGVGPCRTRLSVFMWLSGCSCVVAKALWVVFTAVLGGCYIFQNIQLSKILLI